MLAWFQTNVCVYLGIFFFGGGVLMQIPCENEDWGESRGEKKLSDVMRHY